MKQWCSFYHEKVTKSHQVGGQLEVGWKSQQIADEIGQRFDLVQFPYTQ